MEGEIMAKSGEKHKKILGGVKRFNREYNN